MTNIKTIQDKIIIHPDEVEEKTTSGGIVIPGATQDKSVLGNIVATGPGRYAKDGTIIKMNVKVGDRIFYARYSGAPIKYENETLLIINENDVLAIIKE